MSKVEPHPLAEWMAVQRTALRAKMAGRLPEAASLVSEYLESSRQSPLVGEAEALAFRALLLEELRDLDGARADAIRALGLAPDPSYLRFTLQLSLASFDEKVGRRAEAIETYMAALRTALADGRTSAGTALQRLLELASPEELSSDQHQLVGEAIRASWRLLRMQGDPEVEDLRKAARLLMAEQSRPR